MIKTSLIIFVLLYMVSAHSQQTIDKLNANQLKLPKETVQKALSIDATGQVKSSSTSDTELGYLSGTTSNVQDQIDEKANDTDAVHLTGNESISGIKTFTGRLETSSTTNASLPCPVMTQAQRDLIASPVVGDCVYNNDTDQSNIYDGSIWKSMGGSGGISLWLTTTGYAVDDVVIESNKIYICLEAHTSGTFATDLAASKWLRVSTDVSGSTGVLPLTNGGSNKTLTASDGSIVYSDTDSLELLAPGTSGQILQTNGAAAPTFVNKSISAKAENGSSVTLEEIQVPNNQLTTTATNKHLLNDCGSSNNLLANCGFEHSTPATSWTLTNGSSAVETSNVKQGKQSLKLTLSAQALDFYQTSTLNATAFADGVNGSISISVKTTVDNVYLCRTDSSGNVVDNTDGTKITDCVKAPNTGKWSDLTMPIVLGATQNGLALVSLTPSTAASVAVTGDVYVDQGILEAGLKAPNMVAIESQSTKFTAGSTAINTILTGTASTIGSGNYSFSVGTFTALRDISVTGSCTTTNSAAAHTEPTWYVAGTTTGLKSNPPQVGGFNANASFSGIVLSGQSFYCRNNNSTASSGDVSVLTTNISSQKIFSAPSDSFSTDTNTLAHKTTAIVAADPIGTYNTYSYAINTNTKTICGTAPSILPNAADGFKIFTRAYNAASTCGNPARVEIKIGAAGTKFPTIKTDIYKSAAKTTIGSVDFALIGTVGQHGLYFKNYDELTGLLVLDSGLTEGTTYLTNNFVFSDVTTQTSGFLVINAQKMKDSIVGSFAGVNTSPSVKDPVIYSFQFSSAGVVSNDDSDLVNGNCTNANPTVCTYNSNKFAAGIVPSCVLTGDNVDRSFRALSSGSTAASFTMFKASDGTTPALDTGALVICKGKLP